jgi:hypothetical protein
MQAGDSQVQGLLPVVQGMSRIVMAALTGQAGGQQQQHQYIDAHITAQGYCAACSGALQALDDMYSIALVPLARSRGT